MAANIPTTLSSWSTTASSNQPDSTDLASTLREDLQAIQAAVRYLRTTGTIASAGTTDLATKSEEILSVSGTTTITALGTVSAGMIKVLVFEGALTFTHNGTSLILPGAANITTAAGDVATMLSLGSGNWRCLGYSRASGFAPKDVGSTAWTPVLTFATAGNLSVAYSTQAGQYCRVGNLCIASFTIITSSFTHTTASGQLRITGLPFTAENTTDAYWFGNCQWAGITRANYTDVAPRIAFNTNYLTFKISGSGQVNADVVATDMPTGGSLTIAASIVYLID